jgi:hypothetical protein
VAVIKITPELYDRPSLASLRHSCVPQRHISSFAVRGDTVCFAMTQSVKWTKGILIPRLLSLSHRFKILCLCVCPLDTF